MDFDYAEEERLFRDSVRAFVRKECTPEFLRAHDLEGKYPTDLMKKMAALGWFSAFTSEADGGQGLGASYLAIMAEELSRAAPSIASGYYITIWGVLNIALYGSQEQKDYYLPRVNAGEQNFSFSMTEPDAGSDAASLRARAELDGDEWVINGEKLFCTQAGAPNNTLIVCVRTDPNQTKHRGISLIFVPADAPGVTLKRMSVMARRMLGTYEIHLDNVRVPKSSVLGEPNKGWEYITSHLERERMCVAASSVGNAKQVLEDAVTYLKQRKQFGRSLSEFQVIRHLAADLKTSIDCASLLTQKVAWMIDNKIPCNAEAAEAKLFATETLLKTALEGMRFMGGYGLTEEFGMARAFRDAMGAVTGGGASNIQREIISRAVFA